MFYIHMTCIKTKQGNSVLHVNKLLEADREHKTEKNVFRGLGQIFTSRQERHNIKIKIRQNIGFIFLHTLLCISGL